MSRAIKRRCPVERPGKEENSTAEESLSTEEHSLLSIGNAKLEELLAQAKKEIDELRTHNTSLREEAHE